MSLWFVFALMTAAAAFAVLWPLGRRSTAAASGHETAVYKDQLAELDRDLSAGLIAPSEAEAARIEISRRLLAAAESSAAPGTTHRGARRAMSLLALIVLPLGALAFYLPIGSPHLPDVPLASRMREPAGDTTLAELVTKVEAHLEKNPTDGRGWNVLAPVLARLGRYDDAVRAYRGAIQYGGDGAEKRASFGEMLVGAAGGVVTAEAKAEFERAAALDAAEPKARYFLGLAASQDGRNEDAAAIWRKLLEDAPDDAPWRLLVANSLARIAPEPGPSAEAMKDAANLSAEDRSALIQSMVERLSARLKQDGGDVDGWLRLVRAYMVMGDASKAKASAAEARQALGGQDDRLRALNDRLKALGFDG